MDLIGSLLLMLALFVIIYSVLQNIQIENKIQLNKNQEESNRKEQILNRVEEFIKGSKFVEPIATWKGEKIYKYIFKDGYLYEFKDTFTDNNQKIGIDDEFLCFKQICYKRVTDPTEFIQKFGKQLGIQ